MEEISFVGFLICTSRTHNLPAQQGATEIRSLGIFKDEIISLAFVVSTCREFHHFHSVSAGIYSHARNSTLLFTSPVLTGAWRNRIHWYYG